MFWLSVVVSEEEKEYLCTVIAPTITLSLLQKKYRRVHASVTERINVFFRLLMRLVVLHTQTFRSVDDITKLLDSIFNLNWDFNQNTTDPCPAIPRVLRRELLHSTGQGQGGLDSPTSMSSDSQSEDPVDPSPERETQEGKEQTEEDDEYVDVPVQSLIRPVFPPSSRDGDLPKPSVFVESGEFGMDSFRLFGGSSNSSVEQCS